MADIKVQPDDGVVTVHFHFFSPQQYFYTVSVINKESNSLVFRASGAWNGRVKFDLGKAQNLMGLHLVIDWTVIDPAGAGHDFRAAAIVMQHGSERIEHQECKGKTSDNQVFKSTTGKFIAV